MIWSALTLLQAAGLWAVVGALALWLYRRSRQPVKRRVSSLRLWTSDDQVPPSRRKLREPLSLLAHLAFLLFLILALADPHIGRTVEHRRVVVIVDTSIWSQAQPAGQASVIERERQSVAAFLQTLPVGDPVLLLKTDADVTAALPFTTDRPALLKTLASLQPSAGLADLPRAVEIARDALSGSARGLIVYVGPGMLDEQQTARLADVRKRLAAAADGSGRPQFLTRLIEGVAPGENRGLTGLALQRDPRRPDRWHVLTRVRNYGRAPAALVVTMSMDGYQLGQRSLSLAPGASIDFRDELTVSRSGILQAEIAPADLLAADDRARVAVPAFRPTRVRIAATDAAFANRLRTALDANPYVKADVASAGAAGDSSAEIVIHQGVAVPDLPPPGSIWFVGAPRTGPPAPVRIASWNLQHPVTRWVRTRDVSVRRVASIQARAGDVVLASGADAKPIIVAREQGASRSLIIGFDPRDSNVQEQAAFPLLMAGATEWLTRPIEDTAGPLIAGALDVAGPATRILTPSNTDAPFASLGRSAHLLALEPGVYRVAAGDTERLVPVNAPSLPTGVWKPTTQELADVDPEPPALEASALWRWLVGLALLAVWTEWRLFSYGR
jgi:hypothetical protein